MATVFHKFYWSILQTSIIICMIVSLICALVSDDFWQLISAQFRLRGHVSLIQLRENLLFTVKDSPVHFIPYEWFKFALTLYIMYGKEILFAATIVHMFPAIKSKL